MQYIKLHHFFRGAFCFSVAGHQLGGIVFVV